MKILLIAAELAPLAPGGGVAQYLMGLARALKSSGQDVRITIPHYGFKEPDPTHLLRDIPLNRVTAGDYFSAVANAGAIYRAPTFKPWIEFSKSVSSAIRKSPWVPDVIHCHDGHASLVPVLLRDEQKLSGTARILTIHNLLEQGKISKALYEDTGLPDELFWSHFEFYGEASCLKAGLNACDRVTTVSPTYAREIVSSEEFGFGLAGFLRALPHEPVGIVNGIDGTSWKMPGLKYDGSDSVEAVVEKKLTERESVLPRWRVPPGDPIIGFKARWDRQKGIELVIRNMEAILESACFVFDTWGEPKNERESYWDLWLELKRLEAKYPLRLTVNAPGTTSPTESAALYTLADFLLMPSVYEPCGLAQMECQRYGCVPIVRRTGGLADTVHDYSIGAESANGFVFNSMTDAALISAVSRAVAIFRDTEQFKYLIQNTLSQDNDWNTRVTEYVNLYSDTTEMRRTNR